jgi:AhpD family alkylhydroperoxidase
MDKKLDEREKTLIAIGAAVCAHCQPCLAHHVEKARELGIDPAHIRAAIEVGNAVEKGSSAAMRKFSDDIR